MKNFLKAQLLKLKEDAKSIKKRLKDSSNSSTEFLVEKVENRLDSSIDICDNLAIDESLGEEILHPQYLNTIGNLRRQLEAINSIITPVVERYNDEDEFVTKLYQAILDQINIPSLEGVVSSSSDRAYMVYPNFSCFKIPSGSSENLLDLPLLLHEFAHVLQVKDDSFMDKFRPKLKSFIEEEKEQARAEEVNYESLYDHVFEMWQEDWGKEFISDMIATYILGEAFAWRYLGLVISKAETHTLYHPSGEEESTHPSLESRMRSIMKLLSKMNTVQRKKIKPRWEKIVMFRKEDVPQNYYLTYPDELFEALSSTVFEVCKKKDIRSFQEESSETGDILQLLREARSKHFENPENYPVWENEKISKLKEQV